MLMTSVLAALVAFPQGRSSVAGDEPARIVWLATRAVEGDSAAAVSARWAARLKRDPADRAAELGLATLARLTYQYDDAERRYARLLPPAGRPPDGYAAYARLGHGTGLRTRGLVAAAEPWLAQAVDDARAAGDSAAETEAIIGQAATRLRTRGMAAAESLLTRASRTAPPDDARLQALLHCTRAGLLVSAARPEAARDAVAGAELARRAGEPRIHAACRHAAAQDLLRRGDVTGARQVWLEVQAELRQARDRASLAAALQWRGYASTTVGAYGEALEDYRAAVAEAAASGNQSAGAFALSGLARISFQSGDAASGMRYAARAKALFEAQGDRIGALSTLSLEAELARIAGRPSEATARYRDALAMAQRDGRGDWVVPLLTALVDLALAAGDWNPATRLIDSAAAAARVRGMPGWERGLSRQRGLVALSRNDLDAAADAFRANASGSGTPFRNYQARVGLAEVYARQGDAAKAERELAAATDTLELWRASLSDRELRLYVFQIQEHWVDPDLGIATVLARVAAGGRVAEAFHLAERRRARELLDRLVQAHALRGVQEDSAGPAGPASTVPAMHDVAAALPDDRTALLEYVTGRGGEPTLVFVITRSGGAAYVLPPIDSLSDAVGRFSALVEAGEPPAALSRGLGRALLDPVLAALPGTVDRLVIVPDDVLHRLPFDALVAGDGRAVVDRFTTSVVPSATIAVQLWKRAPIPGDASLLAFADPVFPSPGPGADEDALDLPRLPATRAEAEAAARHAARAEVRVRDRASEAFLKSAPLSGYGVVHFATHAVVDERSIARTVLALAAGDGEDGMVGPGDLAALRLNAHLVILSACRTAGGVVVRGEGIQGLTGPLLQAGARSILATQWRVPDRATGRFISGFYDKLATGLPVSDALRQTKLDARRRSAPASEWAAFVLVGDPMVRVFGN